MCPFPFFIYFCRKETFIPKTYGPQDRQRRQMRHDRIRKLGHGARQGIDRKRTLDRLVRPQSGGARKPARQGSQSPLFEQRTVRPHAHKPLGRSRPGGFRGRHRHPGQPLGLPEKDARNADRSAQGEIRHLGHQRHRPGRLHHRRGVYARPLRPLFQATGHHHRSLPCRRGFARTALLPYGGLHRSGKFAYDRTQIRHRIYQTLLFDRPVRHRICYYLKKTSTP